MKKINRILFTCAGGSGPLYLAKKMRKKYKVFLVDASPNSPAPQLGLPFRVVPFGSDPKYINKLSALIRQWRIQCIVPGADEELLPVRQLCEKIPGLMAVMPSASFTRLCLNKKNLMVALEKLGISSIETYRSPGQVRYPAIIKPIFGRGSRGVHTVKDKKQLSGYLALYNKKFNDLLVQPYIPGDEYTVSLIVNNRNQLQGIAPKKIIQKTGITKAAVSQGQPAITKACKKIVEKLKPMGPCNIQLKIWKGKAYIFEINPRLSTTSVLTDKCMGNEVELYIQSYDAQPKKMGFIQGIKLFRYDENVFQNP
ncbi:MAG: ATP-grasp domain-containing protein [Patescibacteria group bacterium]|jgi:carbamoyl-phosphate synthase large subunit